ncbi:hypothetical protein GGF46_002966 [Coemansia sp. RSA 552]|nr:hypothetical protein GGF46_002966 [Coemansia sp. RSA 552]
MFQFPCRLLADIAPGLGRGARMLSQAASPAGAGLAGKTRDISPVPTPFVRVTNLPGGTTASDIRKMLGPATADTETRWMKSLNFEHGQSLGPLRSCRIEFYNKGDAADFKVATNNAVFSGHSVKTSFVRHKISRNEIRDQYLGTAPDRAVFLYGYPRHVHQHQIRDYYREYEISDTFLPGVQAAPGTGVTFLSRRGAFIILFSTPAEARRFVRDVYGTTYMPKPTDADSSPIPHTIRAILMQA